MMPQQGDDGKRGHDKQKQTKRSRNRNKGAQGNQGDKDVTQTEHPQQASTSSKEEPKVVKTTEIERKFQKMETPSSSEHQTSKKAWSTPASHREENPDTTAPTPPSTTSKKRQGNRPQKHQNIPQEAKQGALETQSTQSFPALQQPQGRKPQNVRPQTTEGGLESQSAQSFPALQQPQGRKPQNVRPQTTEGGLESQSAQSFPALQQPQGRKPKKMPQQNVHLQTTKGSGDSSVSTQSTQPLPTPQQPKGKTAVIQNLPTQIKQEPVGVIPSNPVRKSVGTMGRRIMVESNHLRISLTKKLPDVIHYDVQITPNTPRKLFSDVMELFRKKFYPKSTPAFDSRCNLYSTKPLFDSKSISGTVSVLTDNDSRSREFNVVVTFAAYIDLTTLLNQANKNGVTQREIQCIDIVFNQAACHKYIKVLRSYFSPSREGKIVPLGDGMECWFGFFQSAILGWNKQLFLNVDVAHKAFPIEQSVLSLVGELCRCNVRDLKDLRPDDQSKLVKFIKGLKVVHELPKVPSSKRVYRVVGIGDSARKITFKKDDKTITVEQYYLEEKKYRLQYPLLPCLHVGDRNKSVYIPLELCTIEKGQAVNRKLTENQTRLMIRETATKPQERKNKILTAIKKVDLNNDPCLAEFGIKLEEKFTEIEARILDPPSLEYKVSSRPEIPRDGVWRPNQFYKSAPLTQWGIITLERYAKPHELQMFTEEVQKLGNRNLGMDIKKCSYIEGRHFDPDRRQNLLNIFRNLKQQNYQLVFVVLPVARTTQYYAMIKHIAEIDIGILTQCIQLKTIGKLNASTISNILLKVNAKLNGINHRISPRSRPLILERPAMIVGADVTHPSPDQQNFPSVAAVAASHDPNAFQYNFLWRFQPKGEIIQDMQAMMKEQLLYFFRKTKYKPEAIVVFRDGVSDGEFENVRHAELSAIRRACQSLEQSTYEPKITFVVVQKRHHTRLFPCKQQDADRNGNVLAGTCVDTVITHPTEQDFYLCSHASIQGTSRPTKYRVLWDDINFSSDEIQKLAYYLCHLYTRCTRSVSYPAPTYYAHLAAFRSRHYLEQTASFDIERLAELQQKNAVKLEISKDLPMYFV